MSNWFWDHLSRNKAKCLEIRNRVYPEDQWPGEIYVAEIRRHGGAALLEIGCGRRANVLKRAADRFERCVGIDPDCEGVSVEDPRIELQAGDASVIPFPDGSFDVVAMNNTAEHLADPTAVFTECGRVLKPGGHLIIHTVNQWFPPIAAGRILPHSLRIVLNRVASGTAPDDTFPAYYRANTLKSLEKHGRAAGLEPVALRPLAHHPTYLLFSPLVYRAGVACERFMTRRRWFRGSWPMLHATFAKPR